MEIDIITHYTDGGRERGISNNISVHLGYSRINFRPSNSKRQNYISTNRHSDLL